MDKQMLKDQIDGLRQSIMNLRAVERQHIKAQTLAEQIEKARVEADGLQQDIKKAKEAKDKLKDQRASSMENAADGIEERMNNFLPSGAATFTINEDQTLSMAYLAHFADGSQARTPYLSLSGGEKVVFDLALSNALLDGAGCKVIIGECAELDDEHLQGLCEAIAREKPDAQIVLNSCHRPAGTLPECWKLVEVN